MGGDEVDKWAMKPEQQVCSLDLAKRLKEFGVKQESLWHYGEVGLFVWDTQGNPEYEPDWDLTTSAFTVAELGEMLPKRLEGTHPLWYLTIHCNNNYFDVSYETFSGKIEKDFGARDKNEANARAKMLVYLLENKLLVQSTK